MKVEQILKQLTPERKKREIETIQNIKLPPEIQKWVKEYKDIGGKRPYFIWQWAHRTFQLLTFSSVSKKYQKSAKIIKFLILMFIVLLDDVADKTKNKSLLNKLLKIPLKDRLELNGKLVEQNDIKYFNFAVKIWDYVNQVIQIYPRYGDLKDIFSYDIDQLLNAMRYAIIVNNNYFLINTTETWTYFSHNMQGMISCDIDLMCSSKLDIQETGLIRKITWDAQQMTRIGNWLSSWEREIKEDDFTSGIFAYAIENNIINIQELQNKNNIKKIIVKIKESKIEKKFLEKWVQYYNQINMIGKNIKSENIEKFLEGLEKWMILELSILLKGINK